MNRKRNVLVLTPVYNESAGLDAYEAAVREVLLARTDCDVHVLFIEDGSSDDSWTRICALAARDARFRGIRLSRNYGSHIALSAGFANVGEADAVATLACDLQDPPEAVSRFIDTWKSGADIVWGKRLSRATMAATGPLGITQWACMTSNFILPVSRHSAHRLLTNTTGVRGYIAPLTRTSASSDSA